MTDERKRSIGVFSIIALLFIIMAGQVLVRVYVRQDFPIFTDQDQIDQTKAQEFGILANYI